MNPGSAIVSFNGLDVRCGVIQVYARGDRENIRTALRRACSHRRRLVSTRPSVFFVNCMHEIQGVAGSDNVDYLGPDRTNAIFDQFAPTVTWRYRIWMKDRRPTITFGNSDNEDMDMGLFDFLGMEYKRPYEWTEARKKRRGGRPSGLRKNSPEVFSNLKDKNVRKQQALTQQANGKALDLKQPTQPRRTIRVDFSEVMEDFRAMSRLDREEMDPEYESRQRAIESREQQA